VSAALDGIAERLEVDGFSIARDAVDGYEAVVGRRARLHWTLTSLHVFVFLFGLPGRRSTFRL
jgi:hypothetical protein